MKILGGKYIEINKNFSQMIILKITVDDGAAQGGYYRTKSIRGGSLQTFTTEWTSGDWSVYDSG